MLNREKISLMLLLTAMLAFQNCGFDIEETQTTFKWVEAGHELSYDLITKDERISGYTQLQIVEDPGVRRNLTFHEYNAQQAFRAQSSLGVFSHVYRLNDGLHTTACFKCGIIPCLSVINYLIVPAQPVHGQVIPDYRCGDLIMTNHLVIATDSLVSVPLGEFRTFVTHDTLGNSVKFWSESVGLIRVDNYSDNNVDTVHLCLSKINY